MKTTPAALEALRDIHLPEAVSQFPALGWWLLLALAFVLITLLGRWRWQVRRRSAYRRAARLELVSLRSNQDADGQWLAALNQLLKRVALHAYPRSGLHAMSGQVWVEYLNAQLSAKRRGPKPLFAELTQLYRADVQLTQARRRALIDEAEYWLAHHRHVPQEGENRGV
ncbi:MAG: DUF4381 domain-containing protein [Pseudomonadales bacterium]